MSFPQLDAATTTGPIATITTNHGEIKIRLFPEQAPKAVANFIALAKKGYYNGIIFHRVIPDFMIQGGDPTGTGMGGESSFGGEFEDEFSDELFNIKGALSMANAGPNTNGSQFFIVSNENVPAQMVSQMQAAGYPDEIIAAYKNGGTPWLDHRHTVFGQVFAGLDVVKEISAVARNAQDKPKEDVVMTSIEITD
ncbi:cyclophilin-type peptidyl-prolyl cis-trans isomerase [Lapidilactobacillus concavus DSM 17758]|uniref:Peptidyl-prolyl cis-trans isomerase n=1 Tax=Lapidilactobacillus concavus DSM 17758 TaxID=1423735 RepID=A0A0R1VQG3_9LACO|nr:peptidylprolyl isomerase [Lapidilactobacillus concavus]KRM08046.1 cyclophilin-type peptidyl-prolyl cis-trans isomerase [Lapidilactobacillus concavus DSM 17758]GEL12926.1 peptidyl-prolyl cis-trans isomerase [Lapidilactobacillus concavus]